MSTKFIETPDWSTLPTPKDDEGTRHLRGMAVASIQLPATDGSNVDLSVLKGLYAYPRTGRPNEPNPDGWELIPGARGCTPQSCAFRDHYAELRSLCVSHLFGLLAQDTAWQREAAERLHLPFPILSDESLRLTMAMRFPTFKTSGIPV